jgi:hypothetical protein
MPYLRRYLVTGFLPQNSPYAICNGQTGTGTSSSGKFGANFHSTGAPQVSTIRGWYTMAEVYKFSKNLGATPKF